MKSRLSTIEWVVVFAALLAAGYAALAAQPAPRVRTVRELIASPGPILVKSATQPTSAPATQPTQPASITIYCAENGSDYQGNGSQANPYRTMKHGADKLRIVAMNGRKTCLDKLRLKSGDTFTNDSAHLVGWNGVDNIDIDVWGPTTAGLDAIIVSEGNGLSFNNLNSPHVHNLLLQAAHRNPASVNDLKITTDGQPLHADRSNGYGPGDGLYLYGCNDYDIQNVTSEFFQNGFTIIGDHCRSGLVLNCEAYDCYSTNKGFAQGFFIQGQLNLTLDHPVAVRCGWCKSIPQAPATMFSHGFYLRPDGGQGIVTLLDPVAIECASSGITADCGALVIGGLSISNSNAANAPNIWVGNVHSEIHAHTSLDGAIVFLAKTGEVEGCVVTPHFNQDGTRLQPMEVGIQTPALARGPNDLVKIHDNHVLGWDGVPVTVRPNQGGAGVQIQNNGSSLDEATAKRWLPN